MTISAEPVAESRPRPHVIFIVLALIGVWLIAHPYRGIIHDSLFYTGQALQWLHPERYAEDLFFRFGSQDEFTIFSPAYGWLIDRVGLAIGAMIATLIGQCLWGAAALFLIFQICEKTNERIAAIVMVAVGTAIYGDMLLNYAETFANPRLFAEAFALVGLGFTLRKSIVWAGAAIVLSACFHPLIALPALIAGGLVYAFQDRRFWLVPIVGVLCGGALVLFDVGPFGRLRQIMDAEWYGIVSTRDAYVFISAWSGEAWGWLLIQIVATGVAIWMFNGRARLFAAAVLLVTLGGCVVAFVGGEWVKSVLIIQLQTWRAGWLIALFANVAIGILLFRLWAQRENALPLSLLLGGAMAWFFTPVGLVAVAIVLVLIALQLKGRLPVLSRFAVLAIGAISVASCAILLVARAVSLYGHLPDYLTGVRQIVFLPIDFVLFAALAGVGVKLGVHHRRWILPAFAITVAFLGVAMWDRRSTDQRNLEVAMGAPNPFSTHLDVDDQIYWRRGLHEVWFLLQQPSFMTFNQGAGVLFNRETAMEYRRRAALVAPLDAREFFDVWTPTGDDLERAIALSTQTVTGLQAVCGAAGGPDAVVLDVGFDGLWVARWALPVVVDRGVDKGGPPPEAYYLYTCSTVVG